MSSPTGFNAASTVQEMWQTRPPRIPRRQGGKAYIAGVCEGIAVRYQIDPVIIRLYLVVVTLLLSVGGGLLMYALAWMFLPRYGLNRAPGQTLFASSTSLIAEERRERPIGYCLLIFAIITAVTTEWDFASFLALVITGLAWWGLQRRLPYPPAGLIPGTKKHAPQQVNLGLFASANPTPGTTWEPLGTSAHDWNIRPPQPEHRRVAVWPWIVGAITAITIIVGAIISAIAFVGVGSIVFRSSPNGTPSQNWMVRSEGELLYDYDWEETSATVNLAELGPLTEDNHTRVVANDTDATVILPTSVPVLLHCEGEGHATCKDGRLNPNATGPVLDVTLVDGPGEGIATALHPDLAPAGNADAFKQPKDRNDVPEGYHGQIGLQTIDLRRVKDLEHDQDLIIGHGAGALTVLAPDTPYELTCGRNLGPSNCVSGTYNQDKPGKTLHISVGKGIGPLTVMNS
ncbi:PspC domain-containing protein [Corynebacterium tapiri]|nr:PspC domain-containing protein [Corynebacterium tapiri]